MSDAPGFVLVDRQGPVVTLTMNEPKTLNALTVDGITELAVAVEGLSADRAVRAVILTGAGGAFCSGADLRNVPTDGTAADGLPLFHRAIHAITEAPQPYIAAIDGPAVGFGADLALACDLRVMSSRGYLQEKFVGIGLMPDGGGTFFMPRLVGLGRAMEYLLLGTKIDATLALEVGLANRMAEPSELLAGAEQLAGRLAQGPPLAYAEIKRAVAGNASGTVRDALRREHQGQARLLETEDLKEGIAAWTERRSPRFEGKWSRVRYGWVSSLTSSNADWCVTSASVIAFP